MPSLSLYEVFKRVLQQRDETAALQAAALMQQGRVVDLDAGLAMVAAKVSLDLKLPMADAIILATARRFGAVLWTQDADFDGIPGVRYFARRSGRPSRSDQRPGVTSHATFSGLYLIRCGWSASVPRRLWRSAS